MKLEFQSFTVPPASIFSFDITWVLVVTPIVGQVVYPLLKSCGISFTSLRRIGVGMLFAAASMIVAGLVEIIRRREVEEGHFFDQVVFGKHRQASNLNVFWQIPQFLIMGCAEVLAVTTGRHTLLLIIIIYLFGFFKLWTAQDPHFCRDQRKEKNVQNKKNKDSFLCLKAFFLRPSR